MTLSLSMIVKNEEAVLERCLKSVGGVFDEIIITDTGSTDRTKEIASKYTDKIYDFSWQYDFSAARNYSFSLATCDYVMWLDADDVLTEKDRDALIALKSTMDGSVNAYFLLYDVISGAQDGSRFYFYRERIVRRASGFLWKGAVHEYLDVDSNSLRVPVAVTHVRGENKERGRNLMIYIRQFLSGKAPDAREKYYFAKELFENGFFKAAVYALEEYLKDNGWIEDKISACRILSSCHKQLGNGEGQLYALYKSFEYAPPRSAVCCDIGDYFLSRNEYHSAVFWFKLALNQRGEQKDGFVSPDFGDFIPYMWLCYCYDKLGIREKAVYYNNLAGKIKPLDKNYLYNKKYFENSEKLSEKDDGKTLK